MPSQRRSSSTSESLLRGIAAAAGALLLAACGAVASQAKAPDAVPKAAGAKAAAAPATPVTGRPAFDHAAHLKRGPACEDCHADTEKKDRAEFPTVEACMECHEEMEEKAPPEKKVASFLDPATKKPRWQNVTRQSDEIRFSHAVHLKKKVPCADCHRGIEQSTAVSKDLWQDMDACMACHAKSKAPNACESCHEEIGLEKAPPNHDRLWSVRHGQLVRRGAPEGRTEDCALCHTESSCTGCHRSDAPRDHTQHWRLGPGHGLAASLDRDRCAACHEADTCTGCHLSNAPRSHRGGWGAPRARHCIGCHEGSLSAADGGCGTCHQGTPSHALAPPKPPDHRADFECRLCHERLRHAVNGQDCNSCHR